MLDKGSTILEVALFIKRHILASQPNTSPLNLLRKKNEFLATTQNLNETYPSQKQFFYQLFGPLKQRQPHSLSIIHSNF